MFRSLLMSAVLVMVDFPSFGFVFFKHFRHAAREIRATFIVDPVVDRLTHRPIESLNAATLAVLQPIAGFHVIASSLSDGAEHLTGIRPV